MYISLATRNVLASQITVGNVAHKQVFTCGPDDELQSICAHHHPASHVTTA